MTALSIRSAEMARVLGALVLVVTAASGVQADIAATGTYGINVSVGGFPPSGTFDGNITGFAAGPFSVGGTPVACKVPSVR